MLELTMLKQMKRLLLLLITLILGVMSVEARAQTSYDFSASFNGGNITISGTLTNDGTGGPYFPFQTVTNVVFNGSSVSNSNIFQSPEWQYLMGNEYGQMYQSDDLQHGHQIVTSVSAPNVAMGFVSGGTSYIFFGGTPYLPNSAYSGPGGSWGVSAYLAPGSSYWVGGPSTLQTTNLLFSQNGIPVAGYGADCCGYPPPSFGGGGGGGGDIAPEMNASLIPQVGLLLGCLFFLVGRKKENSLTAA